MGKRSCSVSTEENRDLMRIERMHKIEITEINLAGEVVPRPPKSENKNSDKKHRYGYRGKSHGRSGDKKFPSRQKWKTIPQQPKS